MGIDIVLHPSKGTKTRVGIWRALEMYYRFSMMPLVLLLVAAFIEGSLLQAIFTPIFGAFGIVFAGAVYVVAVVYSMLYVLVLMPIGLAMDAAIIHCMGKLLGIFKGSYSNTFTAVVFGSFAALSVLWLWALPIIGLPILLLAGFWGLYVLVAGLANQHGTTKFKAFVVLAALVGIVVAIVIAATAVFLGAFAR